MNVAHAARAFKEARDRYHEIFGQYFQQQVLPVPDDRFWQLHPVFLHEVRTFRFVLGRTNGVAQAADEFFRKPYTGQFSTGAGHPTPTYTLDKALQFAKTWSDISQRLYPALFDIVTGRSDDTYGDLIDSLPLLGRQIVDHAMDGTFTKMSQLLRAVRAACRELSLPAAFVLEGENYFADCLYEAARDYFANRATDTSA